MRGRRSLRLVSSANQPDRTACRRRPVPPRRAANVDGSFFFKNADFDGDRDADFDDLLALARNYGAFFGKAFADGDRTAQPWPSRP